MFKYAFSLLLSFSTSFAQLSIDPPTRTFTNLGGGNAILTSGSDSWNATTDANWILITPYTSGPAGQAVIYVVNANLSANPRTATITVNNEVHTVTQQGYATNLSAIIGEYDRQGGTFSFDVTTEAGVYWSASTDADWVTVDSGSGYGGGSVQFTLSDYGGVTTRVAEIQVGSSAFTVRQSGADVNISPSSAYQAFDSGVIFISVSALADTTWNVSSAQSWISIVTSGTGQGDSTVVVAVGTNPSYLERSGSVEIGSVSLDIRQAGNPNPSLNILPLEATADPIGAYGNIAVLATPDAPWTARSKSSWINLFNNSGAGNGNLAYTVSANPTLQSRTGSIRVFAPYVPPLVDLTTSLQAMFIDGNSFDYSGWRRHRVGDDGEFTGEMEWTLSGPIVKADKNELSVFVDFSFENAGATQRLFGVDQSASRKIGLYVNGDNRLVFQANDEKLISDETFLANQAYDAAVTYSSSGEVTLYAALDGEAAKIVGSANFSSNNLYLAKNSLDPLSFKIGGGSMPNVGILNGGSIYDFRLYTRELRQQDVEALFQVSSSQPFANIIYDNLTSPVASFDLKGSGAQTHGAHLGTSLVSQSYALFSGSQGVPNEAGSNSYTPPYVLGTEGKFPQLLPGDTISVSAGCSLGGGGSQNITTYTHTISARLVGKKWNGENYSNTVGDWVNIATATSYRSDDRPWNIYSAGGTITFPVDAFFDTFSIEFNLSRGSDWYNNTSSVTIWNAWYDNISILHTADSPRYSGFTNSGGNVVHTALTNGIDNIIEGEGVYTQSQGSMSNLNDAYFVLTSYNRYFSDVDASQTFWININELPSNNELIYELYPAPNNDNGFSLSLKPDGDIYLHGNGTSRTFDTNLQAERWYMLGFSGKRGQTFTLYLDGEEAGNTSNLGNMSYGKLYTNNDGFRRVAQLGGWDGSASQFDLYNGSLTASEFRSLYLDQKPEFEDHVVTQGVVTPELTSLSASIEANGGSASTQLLLSSAVSWIASSSQTWLEINSATTGSGNTTLEVFAGANPSIGSRSANVSIAGLSFTVTQAGQPSTLATDADILPTGGGSFFIDVHSGGSAMWTASSNNDWLTVALGQSGAGSGQVMVVANPYTNVTQSRTGSITIGDNTLYFTQRGYELSIDPKVAEVGSNAGAGLIGVSAPIGAVWEGIATQPWITLIGGSSGFGSGTLRYSLAANETGLPRSGTIIVAGEEYTINQNSSLLVQASVDGSGSVTGTGDYDVNASASLLATGDSGYVFSHWTGDAVGSANPLSLSVDSSKSVTAHFIPEAAANAIAETVADSLGLIPLSRVTDNPQDYGLYNASQMESLALGQPLISKNSITGKMNLKLDMRHSSDLKNWSDFDANDVVLSIINGDVNIALDPTGDVQFYRFDFSD